MNEVQHRGSISKFCPDPLGMEQCVGQIFAVAVQFAKIIPIIVTDSIAVAR